MKKFFLRLMAIMMVTATSAGFVSCNDDDDDDDNILDGGTPSSSMGVIDKESGLRLRSFGNYSVTYTEEGFINEVSDGYETYAFSYNPNKILCNNYRGKKNYLVTYNSNGYISAYEMTSEGEDWGNEKTTFSYDGDGHLTSISSSYYIEIEIYGGEKEKESGTYRCTLTWKDGLLQGVSDSCEYEYNEDGKTRKSTSTDTFKYDKEYVNKYKQWVEFYGIDEGIFRFQLIGLLGVGPDKLPSSRSYTINDNGDNLSGTNTCSYEFNEDGSVASANGVNYTYETANNTRVSDSSAETTEIVAEPLTSTKRHHRIPLFMR